MRMCCTVQGVLGINVKGVDAIPFFPIISSSYVVSSILGLLSDHQVHGREEVLLGTSDETVGRLS